MTNEKMKNVIKRLKEIKERDTSLTIARIYEHTGVSNSTVARMFSDKSDELTFRDDSVRPVAEMLLGLDSLDEGEEDEKALKAIVQYKDAKIHELETLLAEERAKSETLLSEERAKSERKLEKERTQSTKSIDFLKRQIDLKDERITTLMKALDDRNEQYKEINRLYIDSMKIILEERRN